MHPEINDQMISGINVRHFGAVGDGQTDDTAAFNDALKAAAEIKGTVYVPDGTYLCADVHMPPNTGLFGHPTWDYRSPGGAVLKLNKETAQCLINITDAVGATLNGLSLTGEQLGDNIHGILMGPTENKPQEDAPRIERCKVRNFSGDGIRLEQVWCFSIRGCHMYGNGGDGLYLRGWDGFVLDNWFSGNIGAGIAARENTASVTITGNRIEWNHGGGILLKGASHYNITGNYIDRSGGPAISLMPRDTAPNFCIAITGNVIYRSGKPEWTAGDKFNSCHIRLEHAHGITFTSNTMCIGQDDGSGVNSPDYGIVLKRLQNSVIKDNALHIGALKEIIVDQQEHLEGVIIKDNPGSIYTAAPDEAIWTSGLL